MNDIAQYVYKPWEMVVYTDPDTRIDYLAHIYAIHEAEHPSSSALPAHTGIIPPAWKLQNLFIVQLMGVEHYYREDRHRPADRSMIRPVEVVHVSAKDTAKLIRVMLKQRFPGVRFSVTVPNAKRRIHPAVYVEWLDGPASDAVDAALDFYRGGRADHDWDGAGDGIMTAHYQLIDGKAVQYGAYYIFVRRVNLGWDRPLLAEGGA